MEDKSNPSDAPQSGDSPEAAAGQGGREAFFAQLAAIAERANVDPEEAETLADEAVRAIRTAGA